MGCFVTGSGLGSFVTGSDMSCFVTGSGMGCFVTESRMGCFVTGLDMGCFVIGSGMGRFKQVTESQNKIFHVEAATREALILKFTNEFTSIQITQKVISQIP